MRMMSATNIKRNSQPARAEPNEGTRMRALWDLLQAFKGRPVHIKNFTRNDAGLINYLRDCYGLDILHVRRGNAKRGIKSQHMLRGEWFGRVYIDYTLETAKEREDGKTNGNSASPQVQRTGRQRDTGGDAR